MLNNEKAIAKAKLLRSWGRSSSLFDEKSEAIENRFNIDIGGIDYDAKFVFETIGYNLEGNEVGAAFGLVQLKNLERNIQIRENNFKKQNDFFKNHDKLFLTPKQLEGSKTGWLAYPILISKEAKFSRKEFQIYLEKRNIQTRVVFTGNVIRQPMMKNVKYKEDKSGYLNSDAVMERGVLLPLHHGMTDQMFVRLHDTINEFIKNHC
jgi:CDP-6-deoxy-D-xylo-4-hexulose-3-dehydrase